MTEDGSRERGILSPADRDYIRNPDEYSRQASYEREKAIRNRVGDGILDFSLLFEHLDDDLREEIFAPESLDDEDGSSLDTLTDLLSGERGGVDQGIIDAIALFYVATSGGGRFSADRFRSLLSAGVQKAEKEFRDIPDDVPARYLFRVNFGVDTTEGYDAPEAVERLIEGDVSDLSGDERDAIVWLIKHFGEDDDLEAALERFKEEGVGYPGEVDEE